MERGAHTPVTGYPGNMLKTKVRQNPITHHKSPFANARAPDSCLLASLLLSKNEGSSGYIYENTCAMIECHPPKSQVAHTAATCFRTSEGPLVRQWADLRPDRPGTVVPFKGWFVFATRDRSKAVRMPHARRVIVYDGAVRK